MCLAVPAPLIERRAGDLAVVDLGGIRKEISLALVEDVAPGDYVIVHVGYAIGVLDPEEARLTLELLAALGRQQNEGDPSETDDAPRPTPGDGE